MTNWSARDGKTICAVATPPGYGGVAVIRVSGPQALNIVSKCCPKLTKSPQSHHIYLTTFIDVKDHQEVDQVLISYFETGRSFTGEEVIEISSHGSPSICRDILEQLTLQGATIAERGEFTYRAFMNDKIDLIQAEGVLSLVHSQSKRASRQALVQLKGGLSERIAQIEDDLIWMLAHIEAGIDFSTENLEVVEDKVLLARADKLINQIDVMLNGFKFGRLLHEGMNVIFVGAPNVGKSSLMNLLLGEDRSIVSNQAGTTRDVVEAPFMIDGIKINLLDTAGIRQSSDEIESKGIERTYKSIEKADLILFVLDGGRPIEESELAELSQLDLNKVQIIINKSDKLTEHATIERFISLHGEVLQSEKFSKLRSMMLAKPNLLSSFDNRSQDKLSAILKAQIEDSAVSDEAVISQARQAEDLQACKDRVDQAKSLIQMVSSSEFVALELKEALIFAQRVLGKSFDDQILDRVFKEFCLGK